MIDYNANNGDIILKRENFDLDEVLDNGQAFRWTRTESGYDKTYTGHMMNKPLTISQNGDRIILHNTSRDEFLDVWYHYFDLETDYRELIRRFSEDEVLSKACAFAPGIRILNQDFEETLLSFILSQNNNIPRIKGIIGRLCEMNGGRFPTHEDLEFADEQTFAPLRAGFRARYLADCVHKLNSGEISRDISDALPDDEAMKKLCTITGVGVKVASCVLLFACHRFSICPVDVWIKRVNERYYPNGFPECTKGFEGLAQQYLFYAIRNNVI